MGASTSSSLTLGVNIVLAVQLSLSIVIIPLRSVLGSMPVSFLRNVVASSSKHALASRVATRATSMRFMSLGPGCRADRWGKCVEHGSAHENNDEDFEELQRRPKGDPAPSATDVPDGKTQMTEAEKEEAAIKALLDRDGGGLGFEFEDGKPDSGMRKGVKREMFRLI